MDARSRHAENARRLAASRQALINAAVITAVPNLLLAVLVRENFNTRLLGGMLLAHALLASTVLVLAWFRPALTRRWLTVADIVLFAPYFVTISASLPVLKTLVDPLFASKLLAIGLATIVPTSFRLHLVLMGGLAFQAAALWLALPNDDISAAEPWATGLFFLTAGWFLVSRWRQRSIEQEIERLRVNAEALAEVAKIFIAVRHLANTPLQKIVFLASMLKQGAPMTPDRLATLDHAIDELDKLLAEFRRYEDVIEQSAQDASLDARRELARLLPERAPASSSGREEEGRQRG